MTGFNLKVQLKKAGRSAENLIVLVHGLGAADTTWCKYNRRWVELLLKDERLEEFDVGIVRYETAHAAIGKMGKIASKVLAFFGLNSIYGITIGKGPFNDVAELARELKTELDIKTIAYKRVAIVGDTGTLLF